MATIIIKDTSKDIPEHLLFNDYVAKYHLPVGWEIEHVAVEADWDKEGNGAGGITVISQNITEEEGYIDRFSFRGSLVHGVIVVELKNLRYLDGESRVNLAGLWEMY